MINAHFQSKKQYCELSYKINTFYIHTKIFILVGYSRGLRKLENVAYSLRFQSPRLWGEKHSKAPCATDQKYYISMRAINYFPQLAMEIFRKDSYLETFQLKLISL